MERRHRRERPTTYRPADHFRDSKARVRILRRLAYTAWLIACSSLRIDQSAASTPKVHARSPPSCNLTSLPSSSVRGRAIASTTSALLPRPRPLSLLGLTSRTTEVRVCWNSDSRRGGAWLEHMAHGFVYKIGESFPTASAAPLPVSDLDRKDGFIHMSTAEQVPATVGRFFKACKAIELLKIPIARVADRVKWESSSNHGIFPHL